MSENKRIDNSRIIGAGLNCLMDVWTYDVILMDIVCGYVVHMNGFF